MNHFITDHIDIWTGAQTPKTNGGRGNGNGNGSKPYGIQKLRKLILELAVRGKLVPQDPNDEPASVLLERIAKEKKRLIKEGKIKKEKPLPEIRDDEKPFDLSQGWEWTRLGIISLINPRNDAEDRMDVSFIPMTLISTSYSGEHGQEIKTWGEIKKGYTHFADHDLGIAKITPCFENSKAVVFSGLINGIGAGTTELHIARPFGTTLAPRYILLFLKTPRFLHTGETKMTGTAGQKRLPKNFFSEFPLPLPPLAEQHRIVAKVDELMALCDRLEQQQIESSETHQTLVETLLSTLARAAGPDEFAQAWQRIADHFDTLFTTEQSIDQLKQTILQLAVMGKLVPQDPNDEPASVLLEKIAKEKKRLIKEGKIKKEKPLPKITEDEKPFELLQGWAWVRLYQIIQISSGDGLTATNMMSEGGIPVYGGNGITGYHNKANVEKPTLVIGRVGYYCGSIHITPPAAWVTDNAFITTFSEHNIDIHFLYWLLKGTNLKENENATAQPVISGRKVYPIAVGLPPTAEQNRIVAKVDELMALCDELKTRLNTAQTLQVQLADAIVERAVEEVQV